MARDSFILKEALRALSARFATLLREFPKRLTFVCTPANSLKMLHFHKTSHHSGRHLCQCATLSLSLSYNTCWYQPFPRSSLTPVTWISLSFCSHYPASGFRTCPPHLVCACMHGHVASACMCVYEFVCLRVCVCVYDCQYRRERQEWQRPSPRSRPRRVEPITMQIRADGV